MKNTEIYFVLFVQSAAVELQEKVVLAIKQVDEKLNFEDIANLEDNEKYHLLNLYRETMLKGYNFGFEVNFFYKQKALLSRSL